MVYDCQRERGEAASKADADKGSNVKQQQTATVDVDSDSVPSASGHGDEAPQRCDSPESFSTSVLKSRASSNYVRSQIPSVPKIPKLLRKSGLLILSVSKYQISFL